MMLYVESIVDQTDHFAYAFVRENIAMMLESLQLTPFCLEKSRVRKCTF